MLSVGDGIADDVLQEDFEDAAGLLVDEAGDPLHAAATGKTTNGRLRDALQIKKKIISPIDPRNRGAENPFQN